MDDYERRALHAQLKARHFEQSPAADEPELTLTAREFDHILRREFAARERSMQEMIEKKVREGVAAALAEHARDQQAFVDGRIDTLFSGQRMEALRAAIGKSLSERDKRLRAEFQEQLGQLRADQFIAKAYERREQQHGGEIVDMVSPLERKRRAG